MLYYNIDDIFAKHQETRVCGMQSLYCFDETINSRNRKTEMYINQKRKFPSLLSHAQFLMPIETGKYYYVIGKYSLNIK